MAPGLLAHCSLSANIDLGEALDDHRDPSALARQVMPLTGSGYHRLRVGSYRVIFAVEHRDPPVMVVLRVRHRREAYEGR